MVYINRSDFSVSLGKIPYLNACAALSDDTYQTPAQNAAVKILQV